MAHSCPKKWASWLPLAEYWYNTSFHSALGRTPFEVLYGYPPRALGITVNDCASTELETWLQERATMVDVIRQQLLRAQQRMKAQADKHRSERTFQVNDLVYLKLQPYIQQSVEARGNQKLAFRFFGPYKILKRIGEVAYKLELPSSSQVHPVVHVSQLKKHVPANTPVSTSLGSLAAITDISLQPLQIVERAFVAHGSATATRIRVRWAGLPPDLTSWEMLMTSAGATRVLLLGDKRFFKGRGMSQPVTAGATALAGTREWKHSKSVCMTVEPTGYTEGRRVTCRV